MKGRLTLRSFNFKTNQAEGLHLLPGLRHWGEAVRDVVWTEPRLVGLSLCDSPLTVSLPVACWRSLPVTQGVKHSLIINDICWLSTESRVADQLKSDCYVDVEVTRWGFGSAPSFEEPLNRITRPPSKFQSSIRPWEAPIDLPRNIGTFEPDLVVKGFGSQEENPLRPPPWRMSWRVELMCEQLAHLVFTA